MNKIAKILYTMGVNSGPEDTEIRIFKLIDDLVPKHFKKSAPKNDYEKGMAHALSVVELRIDELKEG